MYADYQYYKNEYHGSAVPAESYARAAAEADAYIDYATMGRVKALSEVPDSARICACALAELAYAAAQNSSFTAADHEPGVKSESVGPLSVTYATAEDSVRAREALRAEMYATVRQYLWQYLYRGVPCV